jgi:hypothetical protein
VKPGAVSLVELQSAPMKTKFGLRTKPLFKVTGWRGGPAEPAPAITSTTEFLPAIGGPTLADDIADQIPF